MLKRVGLSVAGLGSLMIALGVPVVARAAHHLDPGWATEANHSMAERLADLELRLEEAVATPPRESPSHASWTVRPRGRALMDHVMFGPSNAPGSVLEDAQDATFFRSARLGFSGTGYEVFYFTAELDFFNPNGRTAYRDVLIGVRDLPLLGSVQVGHFKEPLSLDQLASPLHITFMERSLPNAFIPGRNLGVMARRTTQAENATLAFGVFRETPADPPFVADDDYGAAFTMRGTWTPWYEGSPTGSRLLHTGLGYSYRDAVGGTEHVRARPEMGVGPTIVDTGLVDQTSSYQLLVPEVAAVFGPLSVQAEYMGGFYNRSGARNAYLWGAYTQLSYFLTGESRNYSRASGAFGRVQPLRNFIRTRDQHGRLVRGPGAWELTYRYSFLDLDDARADVLGGHAGNHTFGVNWYLTSHARMMFNFVHSRFAPGESADKYGLNVFGVRAQFDF